MPPRPPPRGGRGGPPPRGTAPPRGAPPPGAGRGQSSTAAAPPGQVMLAEHVQTIGVRKTGYGREGRPFEVFTNHFAAKITDKIIIHYDVIHPSEKTLPARLNFEIIEALQTKCYPQVFTPRAVYDGRKNMFASQIISFPSGHETQHEFDVFLDGIPEDPSAADAPKSYKVRLTKVATINPEVLHRFLSGQQSHDNSVLTAITALNVVVRMEPSLKYPFNVRSFFTNRETKDIGQGMVLWRGYFQSVRPAVGRMLINIDISTGVMYKSGSLIDLCLDFFGKPGNPAILAPSRGLPERERQRLSRFLVGVRVVTRVAQAQGQQRPGGRQANPRVIKRLSNQSAKDLRFSLRDGTTQSVADYFRITYRRELRYPDLLCVEVGSGALLPLEVCEVLPGQIMRKQVPPDKTSSVLEFATKKPEARLESIVNGLKVLEYDQSEYLRSFGLTVDTNGPVKIKGRILPAPTMLYGQGSRQQNVNPRNGEWNMIDKKLYRPASINRWIVIIFERQQRFSQNAADDMINGLRNATAAVGITGFQSQPRVSWENPQADVIGTLRRHGMEMRNTAGGLPDIYIIVLPDGAADLYQQIKHFSDIQVGVATQCLKSNKCFRAKPQYYANVCLKINVKLGGVNTVPDAKAIPFLADRQNPAIIIGADVIHPSPGVENKPSFTSMVANIDPMFSRYVAISKVQKSRQEIIDHAQEMVAHCLRMHINYKIETGIEQKAAFPRRIIVFRDGVSEGQFKQVIDGEIPKIKAACAALNLPVTPKLTVVVVGKRHHVRFFPMQGQGDRSGNCPAGLVVDSEVASPAEFDFYLQSHAGLLGTSRPAHYNVLYDENGFTPDSMQQLAFTLCHVYARSTRSVSIPAPVYYADIVCARAKNHFDPSLNVDLSETDLTPTDPGQKSSAKTLSHYQKNFKPLAQTAQRRMYFA
ncbi:related to argonaute-like protein-Laccaria bicolor [Serendipita indica DSM 11827]|uniref:Related to argonaute-like protein-Laccaria bicolor n=1 Tax=Serendipita indica (strain DSM 11827) TaxID=1109443 RepID=G4T5G9_SERID|nr:related to argonaute-like protein-Laccaria bicolor [Serendipita indica DSM 11827]